MSVVSVPVSVGVSPVRTNSYCHAASPASAVQEIVAPTSVVLSTVSAVGATQLGQDAVIVPVVIEDSAPDKTKVPVESRIS